MNNADLEAMLLDLESDAVERKESASDGDKIRQAICAFSNDLPGRSKPGVLFIGVADNGEPAGLSITDDLLLKLGGIRSDGRIQPFPDLTVEKRSLRGKEVAVVIVQPSYSPPVRFDGRVWIRVGPRRAVASADEERRLFEKRQSGNLPFDQRPVPGSGLDDLNLHYFRETYLPQAIASDVLKENRRSDEHKLASLRFASAHHFVPTASGILVLGLDPQAWIPGAYVQFVRFEGTDVSSPIKSSKIMHGQLEDIARAISDYLPLQIQSARPQGGTMRQAEAPDYPWQALRELVFNAIIHRNYETSNAPVRVNWFSDRVEIQNPGGLHGQTNESNYEFTTDYRNRAVAEAMKVLGYVERFGVGISRAKSALRDNGNPPPEFQFLPEQTLVTVRSRP
jgi:ATP-dependent DNA helicase RecG